MFTWITENRLFDLALTGKRTTHLLAAVPLSLVISLLAQLGILPVIIAQVLLYGLPEQTTGFSFAPVGLPPVISGLWLTVSLISAFWLMIVFTWLWMGLWEGRAPWTIGLERDSAGMKYLRGLALGFLSFTAVVGLLALTSSVELESGDPSQQGLAALGGVSIVFIGWVVQGAAEEVLTRGWLMQTLGARYKAWVGILVSSLIFALLHGLNPNLSLIALLNLALFGLFAAFYALREGSLWGICAYHSIWNWVQGNFFGFEVSGGETSGGILLNVMETGNDLWTGGAFGPEGGLAVTAVLLVSMLLVFFVKIPSQAAETSV